MSEDIIWNTKTKLMIITNTGATQSLSAFLTSASLPPQQPKQTLTAPFYSVFHKLPTDGDRLQKDKITINTKDEILLFKKSQYAGEFCEIWWR